jgi:hypothetical protein
MLRNARLCCVFALRRTGERAFFAHRNHGANLAQGDVPHHATGIRKYNDETTIILFLLAALAE